MIYLVRKYVIKRICSSMNWKCASENYDYVRNIVYTFGMVKLHRLYLYIYNILYVYVYMSVFGKLSDAERTYFICTLNLPEDIFSYPYFTLFGRVTKLSLHATTLAPHGAND